MRYLYDNNWPYYRLKAIILTCQSKSLRIFWGSHSIAWNIIEILQLVLPIAFIYMALDIWRSTDKENISALPKHVASTGGFEIKSYSRKKREDASRSDCFIVRSLLTQKAIKRQYFDKLNQKLHYSFGSTVLTIFDIEYRGPNKLEYRFLTTPLRSYT